MEVYFEDKLVRYRTEAFSGTGERDAAEVMVFETFTLGNVDILQTLAEGLLKGRGEITNRCWDFVDELNNNGFVDDMGTYDQIAFMKEVLAEIEKVTGVEVKYALWLADKDVVTDRKCYGRDMADDEDFESYPVGPVVLSDIGFDGSLYGYTVLPTSLETRLESLENGLLYLQQERNGCVGNPERAQMLDESYRRQYEQVQEVREVVLTARGLSIEETLEDAAQRSSTSDGDGVARTRECIGK